MRFLAALLLCLAPLSAEAAPARHAVDEFSGDRLTLLAWGGMGADVIKAMRCQFPCKHVPVRKKKAHRHDRSVKAQRSGAVIVPLPRVRPEPEMDEDQRAAYRVIAELLAAGKVYVKPLPPEWTTARPERKSLIGGLAREIAQAFGIPRRFVRGRLICAVNVNAALAERGIRGTRSALAKSFLRWGRPSRPVPGAVAVFNRGRSGKSGHVAIVHSVKPNGAVIYLNPSARRQAWVVGPYRARPIAFRVAS